MEAIEAIEIAGAYAEQQGYDISEYTPSAECDDGQWKVDFRGKTPRPGHFFTVYLDDITKEVTQLFPGK